MHISYFDDSRITEATLKQRQKQLATYRAEINVYAEHTDLGVPEASLYYAKDGALHEAIAEAAVRAKTVKHVIVLGIGGSSLGVEAVDAVLTTGKVTLSVLDTVSVSALHALKREISRYKKANQVAVCIISKSGSTTETLVNAAVLLSDLETQFGADIYQQTYFIGNPGTDFMKTGKKLGAHCVAMPEIIGGRYSVATAVGLIPLALLGHDTDEFIDGYLDALSPTLESVVADSAARIAQYQQLKFPHYVFFAFEPRLFKLGAWYRQLFAESLGKETDIDGKKVAFSMVPAIVTPVELHSVGQLYMSGVPNVYTDFVSFDDDELDVLIPKTIKVGKQFKGYSMQEIATALYGGVIAAYQERQLPYRATLFEENLAYSVGQFMAMRMRETMYIAKLLKLNAFDQPNVELYKQKTKEILFS
jgi:glucose-6-phosphate isomerase